MAGAIRQVRRGRAGTVGLRAVGPRPSRLPRWARTLAAAAQGAERVRRRRRRLLRPRRRAVPAAVRGRRASARSPSKLLATLVSMTVAYVAHRYWSFSHRARTGLRREYLLFVARQRRHTPASLAAAVRPLPPGRRARSPARRLSVAASVRARSALLAQLLAPGCRRGSAAAGRYVPEPLASRPATGRPTPCDAARDCARGAPHALGLCWALDVRVDLLRRRVARSLYRVRRLAPSQRPRRATRWPRIGRGCPEALWLATCRSRQRSTAAGTPVGLYGAAPPTAHRRRQPLGGQRRRRRGSRRWQLDRRQPRHGRDVDRRWTARLGEDEHRRSRGGARRARADADLAALGGDSRAVCRGPAGRLRRAAWLVTAVRRRADGRAVPAGR